MASLTERLETAKRKRKTTVRIQVHCKLQVPKGYTLSPRLVAELTEQWAQGDDLPGDGIATEINWEIDEQNRDGSIYHRTGERIGEPPSGEVDRDYDVRQKLIQTFLRLAPFRSRFSDLGKNQADYGEYSRSFAN